jgi:phosphonate transport system substrate-binding protein
MHRRLFLSFGAATLAGFGLGARAASEDAPLELGVFPYLSARALLGSYQPLREYLQSRLGRQVVTSTAPSFQVFHERTMQGSYDLVITPPHFARMAEQQAKYVPVSVYTKVLRSVVVVRKGPGIAQPGDLRGKTVVVPDRFAIVTLVGLHYLAEQGLRADVDFRLRISNSHASAAYVVAQSEADAAITEVAAFQKQIPAEVREQLRIAFTTGNLPHVMFLAHSRLGSARIADIRQALSDFATKTPEGRAFIDSNGFEGIRAVTEADLKAMDPYAAELRALGL